MTCRGFKTVRSAVLTDLINYFIQMMNTTAYTSSFTDDIFKFNADIKAPSCPAGLPFSPSPGGGDVENQVRLSDQSEAGPPSLTPLPGGASPFPTSAGISPSVLTALLPQRFSLGVKTVTMLLCYEILMAQETETVCNLERRAQ